jgi:membrane-bound lytic murein transglycosylase A
MLAQDTGGAIRGGIRGDVFWGHGAAAEWRAGQMKQKGRWALLLPAKVAKRWGKRRQMAR